MRGVTMINKQHAFEIQKLALEAVSKLSQVLTVAEKRCDKNEYEQIKRGVGLSIGAIQMELLETINTLHPDLDDLK